jgi:phosphomannomutase
MDIPSSIFKAYDIRGLSPGEITEEIAFRVGQAIVAETGATTVVVGRDMRETSLALEAAVVAGIRSQGATTVRIGLTTTPMFYFAVASRDATHAGIMVTASHNPSEYNGFKAVRAGARPIGQESGMEQVRDRVRAGRLPQKELGADSSADVIQEYVRKLQALVASETIQPMMVAIDAGNGMAGHTLPAVLAAYPQLKTEQLYFDLDGRFPNHEANPLKLDTLRDLQASVKKHNAAFGVAFDGDADRVGVVDEHGDVVEAHLLLALLGKEMVRRNPGAKILADVRCGRIVQETVEAAGGSFGMTRVGHAFIKQELRETGAVFAGELSSHFYFKDFFGVECSDLVMLLVAEILSKTGQPLSTLIAPLRKYAHSGEINFNVADKDAAIRAVEEHFAKEAISVWKKDGVRLDFKDWWVSLRSSNTEPLLRLVLEAKTEGVMEEKKAEVVKIIS